MRQFPSQVSAGLSLEVRFSAPAYPPPEFSLALIARGPGLIDLDAAVEDGAFVFRAAAGVTGAWAAGRYAYQIRAVASALDTVLLEDGGFDLRPDLAVVGAGHDARGHARRVLDAIEAVIEGRAGQDQLRYRINNRELERTPIADLLLLRDRYRAELARKDASGRTRMLRSRIVARFD